jgi:uncharacterized protein
MQPAPPPVAPVADDERNFALDTLRGVAVLGILLMNIVVFGLPHAGDSNPNAAGGADWPNITFWFVNQVLFEGKMRAIFSMLFGAGVILLTARAEGRGGAAQVADVYTRRVLWLAVFGLLHAYLIWAGDILFYYGVVGLALYPFRKMSAAGLLVGGTMLLLVATALSAGENYLLQETAAKADAAKAVQDAGDELSDEQKSDLKAWEEHLKSVTPPEEEEAKEIAAHRGDYATLFMWRAQVVPLIESIYFYRSLFWDVAGMMLLGMGLMKLGVFTAARGRRFYRILAAVGYGIGVPLNVYAGAQLIAADFDPARAPLVATSAYHFGRLAVALGHVAVVMLVCQSGRYGFLTRRLSAVGRMPLTNYLFESVACVILFEGFGFDLFDRLQRYQLLAVVVGVWLVQLAVSPLWLRFFRYGPAEWLWRALAYWQLPRMRVGKPGPTCAVPPKPAELTTHPLGEADGKPRT